MSEHGSIDTHGVPEHFGIVRFRLVALVVTGLALLVVSVFFAGSYLIYAKAKPELFQAALAPTRQQTVQLASVIEQHTIEVAIIARTVAALVAAKQDQSNLNETISALLAQKSQLQIISAGVWLEQLRHGQSDAQQIFLWGRNDQERFRNNENTAEDTKQNVKSQEWYVPARLLQQGSVYWSRAYIDFGSGKPVVTCAAPVFSKSLFSGVVAINIDLTELSNTLGVIIGGLESYAFITDRNDKFIAHTFIDGMISLYSKNNKDSKRLLTMEKLAHIQPGFVDFVSKLKKNALSVMESSIEEVSVSNVSAEMLAHSVMTLEDGEARRISRYLHALTDTDSQYSYELRHFPLANDSVLLDDAEVFVAHLPMTDWTLVTVNKNASFQQIVDEKLYNLIALFGLTVLFIGLVAYAALRIRFITPIRGMIKQICTSFDEDNADQIRMQYKRKDELGVFAYWFNLRSQQLELARDHAEEASKAKTVFLAKMSHELRTPLNSIIGFSRRLLKKLDGNVDAFYSEALHRIHNNGFHLLELINDILDISAIESGATRLHLVWTLINEVLADAQAEVQFIAAEKNIDLRVYPLDDDIKIYCDKNRLMQIIVHLMKNAIAATAQGYVRARVYEPENKPRMVAVEISDSGVGISEFDQKRLFREFRQIGSANATEVGAGLGLFLVAKFVEMHNGEIALSSKIGEGSVFTVYIPVNGDVLTAAKE